MKKILYSLLLLSGTLVLSSVPAFATKHTVQVGNFFFSPASLSVSVGDTIKWVWVAGSHTTTSNPGGIPSGASSWDHPITSSSTTYEYAVTVAGNYSYVCTPHAPGMAGTFTASGFTPTLSVAPSNRSVAAAAGNTTFTVTSNTSWSASSNAGWCTATPSGTGNGTITANFGENSSLVTRIATLTVSVSGLPDQSVTVTQAGAAPVLSINPSSQSVTASAGTTSFSITSNTSWTASSDVAWCTVTPTGSGNGTLTATYETNTGTSGRTATLTVTVAGLSPQTVTVVQAGSTVGIGEAGHSRFQVYPNPSRGRFRVITGTDAGETQVTLSDISGKPLLKEEISNPGEHPFDLSGHGAGIYFLRIEWKGTTEVHRIIITD